MYHTEKRLSPKQFVLQLQCQRSQNDKLQMEKTMSKKIIIHHFANPSFPLTRVSTFTIFQSPSFIQWHFPLSYSLTISVMLIFFYNHNACKWWWKFLLLVLYVVIVAFHFSIFYKRCSHIFWYLLFLSSNLHQCNQYYCWDIHIFSKVNMLVVRRKWTNFWR